MARSPRGKRIVDGDGSVSVAAKNVNGSRSVYFEGPTQRRDGTPISARPTWTPGCFDAAARVRRSSRTTASPSDPGPAPQVRPRCSFLLSSRAASSCFVASRSDAQSAPVASMLGGDGRLQMAAPRVSSGEPSARMWPWRHVGGDVAAAAVRRRSACQEARPSRSESVQRTSLIGPQSVRGRARLINRVLVRVRVCSTSERPEATPRRESLREAHGCGPEVLMRVVWADAERVGDVVPRRSVLIEGSGDLVSRPVLRHRSDPFSDHRSGQVGCVAQVGVEHL